MRGKNGVINLAAAIVFLVCIAHGNAEDLAANSSAGEIKNAEKADSRPDRIKIPRMEIKNSPAAQALSEIYKAVVAADAEKKGLNMVMLLSPDEKGRLPMVNIITEGDSLRSILELVCGQTNLKYSFENDTVFLFPEDKLPRRDCWNMETRIYPVESNLAEDTDLDSNNNLEEYFRQRGTPFPEGAKIVFDSRASRLIAINTPDNLALIEDIVRELNICDPQVGIKIEYLKIAESDFRDAVGEDAALNPRKVNASLYMKLKKCEKTRVIASGYVLTSNGQEAAIRMVTEKYFPIGWGESEESSMIGEGGKDKKKSAGDNKDEKDKKKFLMPSSPDFGESDQLGIKFAVTPTVDADRYTISLDMLPVIRSHTGWTEYETEKAKIKMAELAVSSRETKLTVCDGQPALLESSQRDESVDDGDKKVSVRHFTFTTARLVNPDGTFLRNPDNNNIAGETVEKKKEETSPSDEHITTPEANSTVVRKLAAKTDFEVNNLPPDKALEVFTAKMSGAGLKLKSKFSQAEEKFFITMFTKNITLGEILRIFAAATGSKISLEGDKIILTSGKTEYETKTFRVRGALIDSIISGADSNGQALRNYFTDRGVSFPEGTSIAYNNRRKDALVVKNTAENLRRLEALLKDTNIETPLVHVQSDIVEISYDDLEKIISDNRISESSGASFYRTLLKSDKAKVASQKIIAASGEPARSWQIDERYFPESWTESEISVDQNISAYTPSYPELGASTDLGLRLEATATISPNNYTISINLHPQMQQQSGWTEYPYENILDGSPGKNKIIMPELQVKDITTNVKIYDGETVLIGKTYLGFDSGKDSFFNFKTGRYDGKVILFFISAVLVNPDGNPVRQ